MKERHGRNETQSDATAHLADICIRSMIKVNLTKYNTPGLQQNIEAREWFWGTTGPIVEEKRMTTIAGVLSKGELFRCTLPYCA
jgi:hypothetical protein